MSGFFRVSALSYLSCLYPSEVQLKKVLRLSYYLQYCKVFVMASLVVNLTTSGIKLLGTPVENFFLIKSFEVGRPTFNPDLLQ